MADEIIEPKVEETPKEEIVEETPKEESPKEEPKVDPEHEAAVGLYSALKDPERAGATLRQLADLAGFDLAKKADQRELKRDIKTLVKERLGEDNSILAESLGPLLEEVIKQAVNEELKPLKDTISAEKQESFALKIDKTFKELEAETKGLSTKLEKQMLELMEQFNPGPKTPPDVYIRHIFKLAKASYAEAEDIKAQNRKQADNKKSVTVQSGVNPERVKSGSKLPTIREAVEAAMRGESLE
jgi:hypothetical protein